MKKLTAILKNIEVQKWIGPKDVTISGLSFDSRKVQQGQLFIAIKGTVVDGHKFIAAAIEKGATVIVCETLPEKLDDNITYIKVNNPARTLGFLSSSFYDNPSEKLKLIGITGTNGKTTAATLLYKLFQKLGYKSGLLSASIIFSASFVISFRFSIIDSFPLRTIRS